MTNKILKDRANFSPSYIELAKKGLGTQIKLHDFRWSSGNNHLARIKGAISLNYDSLFITNGIHKNEVKNDGIESVLKKYNVTSTYYQSKLKW